MKIHENITVNTWCQRSPNNGLGQYCALGWIFKVYGKNSTLTMPSQEEREAKRKFLQILKEKFNSGYSIIEWNDIKGRTFEEVFTIFKLANL